MSAFEQIVCWNDASVLATTPRDAATLGAGHFQAVHHPLRLRRRRLGERSGGKWVTETEIVKVLQGPLRPDGYLFVPIVGGSGTGKSHLVRWVHEHTSDTAGWESRYLAKNRTSIRRVIEIVIEGLRGPAIEAAQEALDSAPGHTEDTGVLAERLLDELALIVSGGNQPHAPQDTRGQQLRAKLKGQLPDVLRDPVVRRRLTSDGAVVQRLVGLALGGRRDGDGLDDDAIRVTSADLPLTFEEIGDASKGAYQLLGQLATLPDLLDAAVVMINEALPAAVKRVFVSGQVDLIEVFREVRRALLELDRELVLFIEDLTVLHGVEREFLDAIVEPAVSPEGRLCNLRVLFAVTEGHFDDLDTVRTRCDDAYWLDSPYGEGGVDAEEAVSFLGRYLNAARLDASLIEREWSERHGDRSVSNACTSCEYQVACHDGFGTTPEGFGIYPFNRPAVERFMTALSTDRFDPREVVRELVNRFLLQGGAEMSSGLFPSEDLLRVFDQSSEPVEPLLAAQLRGLRPVDHERVVNVLRYWSDDRSHTTISGAVMSGFGLEVLEDLGKRPGSTAPGGRAAKSSRPTKSDGRPQPSDPGSGVEELLKSPWKSHFVELGRWSGQGRDLSAKATNDLRNLVHDVIVKNLEFGPQPVNLGKDFDETRFRQQRDIFIAGSVTAQTNTDAPIVIERSSDSAAALQGLILMKEIEDDSYPGADRYRRTAANHVELWTDRVAASLANASDPAAASLVEGMVVCALVGGHCEDAKDASDFLEVLFAQPPDNVGHDATDHTDKWRALVQLAATTFPRLRTTVETMFGEARGASGGVRAVRADLLLAIIEPFIEKWTLESMDPAVSKLMRSVAPAADAEWGSLQRRALSAEPHIDRDRLWGDQTAKVLQLLGEAYKAGRLRDADAYAYLQRLAERTPERAHRSVFEAVELTSSELPTNERVRVLAGDLPGGVALVSGFAIRAASAIEGLETDLQERRAAQGGESDLTTVVENVLASTVRFVEAMEALAQ